MGLPDAAPRQLAFALDPPENFSREDFLVGPGNAAAGICTPGGRSRTISAEAHSARQNNRAMPRTA